VVRDRPPRAGSHLLLPVLRHARGAVPAARRANRAFHEAVGELARLASQQPAYLRKLGLIRAGQEPNTSAALLQSALQSIVFLPFAAAP